MSSLVGAVFGAFILALAIPVVSPLVLSDRLCRIFHARPTWRHFRCIVERVRIFLKVSLRVDSDWFWQWWDSIRSRACRELLWKASMGQDNALFLMGRRLAHQRDDRSFRDSGNHRTRGSGNEYCRQRRRSDQARRRIEGIKDTFRHWKLVLRCSGIGAYIGLIPGWAAAGSMAGLCTRGAKLAR